MIARQVRIDEVLPFPGPGKDAPVLMTPDAIRPEGAHTNQPGAERSAALGTVNAPIPSNRPKTPSPERARQ